jgi:4'-phosphopantetheinyl transferase
MPVQAKLSEPTIIDVYSLRWPDWRPGLAGLDALLSPDERDRALRYRFDRDRCRFMTCRAWLRSLLGERLAIPPGEVRFLAGAHGKPEIDGGVEFNLSHSGEWAVCAIAEGLPVGIDIEVCRELPEAEAIAGYYFTADEQALLRQGAAGETAKRFLSLWTRKEAYIKALGCGLFMELNQFTVGLDADFVLDGRRRWGLRSLAIVPDHAVALCAPENWEWRNQEWLRSP